MIIFGATILFDYLWKAALLGIAYAAVFSRRRDLPHGRWNFLVLFCVFVFLGVYEVPAILTLDATITVRNEEIAAFFGIEKEAHLTDLCGIDWFDFLAWSCQTGLAYLVGTKLHGRLYAVTADTGHGASP